MISTVCLSGIDRSAESHSAQVNLVSKKVNITYDSVHNIVRLRSDLVLPCNRMRSDRGTPSYATTLMGSIYLCLAIILVGYFENRKGLQRFGQDIEELYKYKNINNYLKKDILYIKKG